jgi:hypothetical protein
MHMDDFYNLPSGVVEAQLDKYTVKGRVLAPYDPLQLLTDNLKQRVSEITTNKDEENLYSLNWWLDQSVKDFDWVVAVTLGSKEYNKYILEYGINIAKKGIIILDRLSFIEPVTRRRGFLLSNPMTKMIVFSPRPKFRAIGSTRDSVTACWFVFEKDPKTKSTEIAYALDWDAVKPLTPLQP